MATPTYPLVEIQARLVLLGASAFTASALDGAQGELSLTTQEAIDMILARTDTECFKTMPSRMVPGAMQDVYRWPTPFGQMAYVKFSLHPDSSLVISFKEL